MLDILHQDEWLVVIDKPAGMLVHPGREPEPPDQIAMKVLRDQIGRKIGTIHRLDRPTSGIVIFALETEAEVHVRKQFERRTVKKVYTAVTTMPSADVDGESIWTSREPIQKKEGEPFREAETVFERVGISEIGESTFQILNVEPKSGRFHQIRKHAALNGTPIVGDFLYGEVKEMEEIGEMTGQSRLMLHASELQFEHPVTGKVIAVRCDLPERFAPFLPGDRQPAY